MSSQPGRQAGKSRRQNPGRIRVASRSAQTLQIAFPGITWGGHLEIFSTHRGTFNYFNELLREITERGNPKKFSLHRVTLEDALAQGFLFKLQQKLPPDDERLAMDESDYFNFIRSGSADEESFQQEFMCQPADDNTAFLPYDLIAGCEYKENEPWQTDLLDCKNPLFVGVDVGREHDLTVIWLIEQVAGINFTRRVVEMSKQTFEAQEHALYELLKLPAIRRCCIDQSGLGRQFAERATQRLARIKSKASPSPPAPRKNSLTPCAALLKIARLRFLSQMPSEPISAAYAGKSPVPVTSGLPVNGTTYGHCDRFWALALALHAAKKPATGAITDPKVIHYGSNSSRTLLAPRRVFKPRTLQSAPRLRYFET